ncbi:MAG TPA: acylphosphatase [Nitrospirota bacterium]
MAGDMVAAEIYVSGRVQGVGYRYFTEKIAARLGVTGWSMNMPDGRVMLDIEADRPSAEKFIRELEKGPAMASVTGVAVTWKPFQGRHSGFIIRF